MSRGNVINAKDNHGWTALTLAAEKGHEAIVKLLNDRHAMRVRDSGIVTGDVTGVVTEAE